MVNVFPDIPDDWRGGSTAAAKLLGISRTTLALAVARGPREGGIACRVSPANGRKVFTGRELRRFFLKG